LAASCFLLTTIANLHNLYNLKFVKFWLCISILIGKRLVRLGLHEVPEPKRRIIVSSSTQGAHSHWRI